MQAKGSKTGNQLAIRDGLALEILVVKTVSVLIAASSSNASNSEEHASVFNITRKKHMFEKNALSQNALFLSFNRVFSITNRLRNIAKPCHDGTSSYLSLSFFPPSTAIKMAITF